MKCASWGWNLVCRSEIVLRQPFPGPGLAVRILGEVTPKRCEILRNADTIVVEEMKNSGWYYKIWQSFAVLLPVRSVGVMGDERTYDYTIAIRAVESQDGMTADWVKLPYDLLEKLSSRIINEVKGVNRACSTSPANRRGRSSGSNLFAGNWNQDRRTWVRLLYSHTIESLRIIGRRIDQILNRVIPFNARQRNPVGIAKVNSCIPGSSSWRDRSEARH